MILLFTHLRTALHLQAGESVILLCPVVGLKNSIHLLLEILGSKLTGSLKVHIQHKTAGRSRILPIHGEGRRKQQALFFQLSLELFAHLLGGARRCSVFRNGRGIILVDAGHEDEIPARLTADGVELLQTKSREERLVLICSGLGCKFLNHSLHLVAKLRLAQRKSDSGSASEINSVIIHPLGDNHHPGDDDHQAGGQQKGLLDIAEFDRRRCKDTVHPKLHPRPDVEEPTENQSRNEERRYKADDDSGDQGYREALHRACSEIKENDSRDNGRKVRVKDHREGSLVARGQ